MIDDADAIYLNPVALGELLSGFADGSDESDNMAELKEFLSLPGVNTVSIDNDSAKFYAAIRNSLYQAGTPIPTNDIWIAASAMQHGLQVLTTDKHFQKVKQVVVEYVEL